MSWRFLRILVCTIALAVSWSAAFGSAEEGTRFSISPCSSVHQLQTQVPGDAHGHQDGIAHGSEAVGCCGSHCTPAVAAILPSIWEPGHRAIAVAEWTIVELFGREVSAPTPPPR
jgi:hypothetical protein